MSSAEHERAISVARAAYRVEASWAELGGLLRDAYPAAHRPSGQSSLVLYAGRSAFRWDIHESPERPVLSIVRLGASPLLLLDHRSKTHRILEAVARPQEPPGVAETADEETRFGPTVRFTLPLGGGAEIRLRVLSAPLLPSLSSWWHLCFPNSAPRNLRQRIPFECALYQVNTDEPIARLTLDSLEKDGVPVSFFEPPNGYRPSKLETISRSIPLPAANGPRPIDGLARESAIAVLLSGAGYEQVKLQLRDEVVERVRTAANAISTRLDTFAGEGLQLDLGPLLDYLSAPGPMTPAGAAAIADRLLLRALFWHWGSQMKKIFVSDTLRAALWNVADALNSNDPSAGSIDPEPPMSVADRDFFRSMRDLIVSRRTVFLPLLDSIRAADVTPAEQIDLLTLQRWDVSGNEVLAARAWFNQEFRFLSLQPEVRVTQRSGRSKGWVTNGYIAEGLGNLIDLDLDVDSVALDFARLAVVGPTAPIDDTDPRFQVIDAGEPNPTPGSRKRAGFVTSLRLNGLQVSGTLSTVPTTRSAAVAALIFFAPGEFLKLWNHLDATIDIGGITADVIVYFEQERLSPAGPALKVWIANVGAATLDVSGFYLSPDPILGILVNPILNELLDHFSPALVDRLAREFFTALDRFLGFVEDSVSTLFGVTVPPRPPRNTPSFAMTVQQALARGFTVRDNIRLQQLLNLNREDLFERWTGDVNRARADWNTAFGSLNQLWQQHVQAAADAGVTLVSTGFNPRPMPRPIRSNAGDELTAAQIMVLQTTFDAWAAQVRVVNTIDAELSAAQETLDEFRDSWPEGQTACEVVPEIGGYRVGLGICRFASGLGARALVYPTAGVSQSGDLTLLLSARAFSEMTAGTGFGYRGDVRDTDGAPAVLWELPAIDWWQHAPEPDRLEPRPADLREGPPQLPPGPSTGGIADWRGYWSVIDVGGRSAHLVPVHNPAPDQHVAEILIAVTVTAGSTTFRAASVERCGPSLTPLVGERPPLGDPGIFERPGGPSGPRPRPDRPGFDIEVGFRRVPSALEPAIVTATALEQTRARFGHGFGNAGNGSGELFDIGGAVFSRPGGFGGEFPIDAHCEVITAWEAVDREVWIDARLELRLPVFLGFANSGPAQGERLPGANLLGARADLPILTYRFATDPVATGPLTLETGGPLAGLSEGANHEWLEALMANHAFALIRNSSDRHRLRADNPLGYAYGVNSPIALAPENFRPYAILAMHPTHWSGADPRELTDRNPPNLRLETFGANPGALNLAINLFIVESLLDKLAM